MGRSGAIGPFRCWPRDEVRMDHEQLLQLMAGSAPLEALNRALSGREAARLLVAPVPAAARSVLGAFLTRAVDRPTLIMASTLEAAARLREDLQLLLGDDARVML